MVMDYLTEAERRAIDLTVDLVNLMCSEVIGDEQSRVGDVREFVAHIHAIQHQIMAQAAARAYPDRFRLLGGAIRPVVFP